MAGVLFQVRTDNLDQIFSRLSLIRFRSRPSKGVITDMPLENFGHEAVHGPSRRSDQTQHISTLRLAVECSRQRLDLTADAGHPLREFVLLPNRM